MSYSSLRKACKPCYKEAWHPMPHGERPSYWYCPLPDAPLSRGSASSVCPRTHCRNRSCFSLPHPRVPEPTAGTQFLPPPLRVPEPLQELQLLFPTSSTVLEPTAGTQLLSLSPHIPEPLQEPQLLLPYSSQLFLVSAQVPVVQCDSFGKI